LNCWPASIYPLIIHRKNSEDARYMLTGEDFRLRNRIGMTRYYRELAIGRLEAVKCGGKTMHTPAQESAWRASLPKYQPRRMSLANEQQEQRTA
jgi:hypothetical protein